MTAVSKVFAFGFILMLAMSDMAMLVSLYSETNIEQHIAWEKHGDASDEKDKSESSIEDNCDDKIALYGIELGTAQSQSFSTTNGDVLNIANVHSEVLTPPPDCA